MQIPQIAKNKEEEKDHETSLIANLRRYFCILCPDILNRCHGRYAGK